MLNIIPTSVALLSLSSLSLSRYLPSEDCPILGPAYPKAFDISNATAILNLQSTFPNLIEAAFNTGTVNRTHTSFSIDVFSATTNKSIYSFHYAAPALNGSLTAGELNDDTICRIGSVSKLFTTYAILAHAGGLKVFDEPVTKYLPELVGNAGADPVLKVVWENISVGALASQMAGTSEFPLEFVTCYNGSQTDCSIPDFLSVMKDQKLPVIPPFQTPLYSDAGFGILGRVLERMTGLPYAKAIQQVLAQPLGLNHSSSMKPTGDRVNGLIVPGNFSSSSWGFDNQVTAPSGGIYSSATDLRTLGLSILNSQLLSPADTRSWLKPRSNTASLTNSVGAPWEINRLPLPVSPNSTRSRISDLYTKAGGQAGYGTIFALSPDHDIGFSILAAGATALTDRYSLRTIVGEAWITAVEHAARENAARQFTGVFVDSSVNGTNLTLSVDGSGGDRPGIGLESFYIAGEEVRANILALGLEIPRRNLSVRLYPMGLLSKDEEGVEMQSYRAIPTVVPAEERGVVQGGKGMFDDGCIGWESVDFNILDVNGIDGFVFKVREGRLESVWHPATGLELRRLV